MRTKGIMKKIYVLLICILLAWHSEAQYRFEDSIAMARNNITKHAMIALASWAVLNISTGFIIANQTSGEAKYAWRMNAYWNFVNLGLATLGYFGTLRVMSKKLSFTDNLKAQQTMEKLYIFNMGLDLAYIAGGLYLRERGNSESKLDTRDQYKGYGTGVIIQGGFLLLFDIVNYSLHHMNTIKMEKRLRQWELGSGPGGIGLVYHF
ncbi:MAG: hypothetical protein C5B59_01070 [Bacteroidetes bacterium]|nr:MAG: hypothetical protein C5B59_01070 [Bacteroidota bacterium]